MSYGRLIPLLLLNQRRLEKSVQFSNPIYLGDPINAVRVFSEFAVDELIVINRNGSRLNDDYFHFLELLAAEAFMPISYGGSLSNPQEIKKIFEIGFDKVVFNSAFFEAPSIIEWTARTYGAQSTSLSINVIEKNSAYFIFNWKTMSKTPVNWQSLSAMCDRLGIGEIMITCVNREGTFQGYDSSLAELARKYIDNPIIINGGLSEIDQLSKLDHLDIDYAASSTFFFLNKSLKSIVLNYPSRVNR